MAMLQEADLRNYLANQRSLPALKAHIANTQDLFRHGNRNCSPALLASAALQSRDCQLARAGQKNISPLLQRATDSYQRTAFQGRLYHQNPSA